MNNDLPDREKQIIADVEKWGVSIVCVFHPDGNEPGFGYSIGLRKTFHQPEVIVFGLPLKPMQSMINLVADQCENGLVLNDWARIEGHECVARKVLPKYIKNDYLNSAMWFHEYSIGHPLREVMQLVWPGKLDGLYPWDEGCAELVIEHQPPLYDMVARQ
jgi:hypothetical protein